MVQPSGKLDDMRGIQIEDAELDHGGCRSFLLDVLRDPRLPFLFGGLAFLVAGKTQNANTVDAERLLIEASGRETVRCRRRPQFVRDT